MAKKATRRRPPHDSDYDGPWKDGFRGHLRVFMALFFPATYEEIDWSVDPVWLDKELGQILGKPQQRNQRVDIMVKLRWLTGEDRWILLHIEVQTSSEPDFEIRVFKYNAGLVWAFQEPVVTLVILADIDPKWKPTEYVFRSSNFESRMKLDPCKILDKLSKEWKNNTTLPVQLARAQIEAIRTASDPEGRFREKWRLVRNLYDLGYTADELREIFRLIDWMMHLRPDLSRQFERDLIQLEEELKMPYVTSVERIAEARGVKQGVKQGQALGKAEMIVKFLRAAVGPLPAETDQRIRRLSMEKLDELGDLVPGIKKLKKLETWLDTHESPHQED